MRSAILVYIPNSNYLLGTYDKVTFKNWWIATGFDHVEFVLQGIHIYGEIHIASCLMLDGTYSIFQSKDNAQTWNEVYNTPYKIYDILLIREGWAILNTDNGFYETVNAGTTWNLIIPLPPVIKAGSKMAYVGEGTIFCTDGYSAFKSTNYARTWTLSCSFRGSLLGVDWIDWPPGFYFDYTGPSCPAIAGSCGFIMAAFGPFLLSTFDNGSSWGYVKGWGDMGRVQDFLIATKHSGIGLPTALRWWIPPDLVFDRFFIDQNITHLDRIVTLNDGIAYKYYELTTASFLVKEIVLSSVNGPLVSDLTFVIRTEDLEPMKIFPKGINGLSLLPGGTYDNTHLDQPFRPFSVHYYPQSGGLPNAPLEKPFGDRLFSRIFTSTYYESVIMIADWPFPFFSFMWTYQSQHPIIPGESIQIASYQVPVTGIDAIDRIVFLSQTHVDQSTGATLPILEYSFDGGHTFIPLDISTLKIGPPDGVAEDLMLPYMEDDYIKIVWVSKPCNNYGLWFWSRENPRRYQNISYEMDAIIEKSYSPASKTYWADVLVQGPGETIYKAKGIIAQKKSTNYQADVQIGKDKTNTYQADALSEGRAIKKYYMKGFIQAWDHAGYQMSGWIISDEFPHIIGPQSFNWRFPQSSECDYSILNQGD